MQQKMQNRPDQNNTNTKMRSEPFTQPTVTQGEVTPATPSHPPCEQIIMETRTLQRVGHWEMCQIRTVVFML